MLKISELYNQQDIILKRKESIFKEVLKKCHHRIKLTAKMYPQNCFCYYIIPKIIYGIPLYKLDECLQFLSKNLIENGFKVYYTHPNLLYITWFKEDTKEIVQKEMPKSILKDYKSIDDYKPSGNLIYSSCAFLSVNMK